MIPTLGEVKGAKLFGGEKQEGGRSRTGVARGRRKGEGRERKERKREVAGRCSRWPVVTLGLTNTNNGIISLILYSPPLHLMWAFLKREKEKKRENPRVRKKETKKKK